MSGQKVCKGKSMKAPESKGMIRESYKHLATLGNRIFFKNFAPIIVGSGALYLPSTSEELRKAYGIQRFSHLRELGRTVVSKLGNCLGSGGVWGLRRLRVRRACVCGCVAASRPSRGAESLIRFLTFTESICSQGVSPKSAPNC